MLQSIHPFFASEAAILLMVMYGTLIFATGLFYAWGKVKPAAPLTELKLRTRSWWVMAVIFSAATVIHPVITFISIAFLSFVMLRELFSLMNLRMADRKAVFFAYVSIPVQYFFAYQGWHTAFLVFIPVCMYVWIPLVLVIEGETKGIIQSMTQLTAILMLTVFCVSHLAHLLSLPAIEGFSAGGRGLLLFVVFMTEINDVMQFVWGKLVGKHKILPGVSPNKTWEGFIGGIISTAVIGYFLRFLTPLNEWQAPLVSLLLGIAGFSGDVIISAVKRDLGLKDTSKAIPGHGGILDRVDSLAITSPVFFYLVYFMAY
ncbi:MAG: phosphatidate cytidylyltransferase [Bacteroidia bacterium]|nr:phosphatidate cytidylyltransferase [Bacteroidia bacterium]